MNMSSSPSLGKYSCTPAQDQQARTALCSATRSAARSAARCALRLRDALRARSDELHNAMPCQKTRKCARSTSAHSALLRSAPLRAPLARSAARSAARYAHALCALCSACALARALRSARAAQRNAASPMQPTSYYHHPTTRPCD